MSRSGLNLFSVALCGPMLFAGAVLFGFQSDETVPPEKSAIAPAVDRSEAKRPSPAEARERSEILHELIHQMLPAVHENYYREDEGLLLPATTFGRVFEKFAERRNINIRWLAVDAEPMNVDHRPQNDFEHAAVKALKSGESAWEETSGGQYLYAGAIRLTSQCLKCHVPNRTSTRDRIAGIVISMPVAEE